MTFLLLFIHAQAIDTFSPRNVLQFADHLYAQADYAAALQEYRRYLFLSESREEDISERIIDCLIQLERFGEALEESVKLKNDTRRDFAKGWIYFLIGKYDSSRIYLSRVGIPYKSNAHKLIGLGYAYEFRFQRAGQYIPLPDNRPHYKKPALGALCALFPGGGHLYCRRPGDAIFSFLVISTSALLSYYYYDRDEDIKFGFALGATLLFYTGNIYGGINAVRNYNYYQNDNYLQTILKSIEE